MTTMKTAYILAAAAAALIPAGAAAQQQLDKEIVIERDIVPQLDPATRQNPGMTVLRPAITPRDLQYSDRTAPVMTVPQNITLEPAAGAPPTMSLPTEDTSSPDGPDWPPDTRYSAARTCSSTYTPDTSTRTTPPTTSRYARTLSTPAPT